MNDQWYLVMILMLFAVAIALVVVCIYRHMQPMEPMKPLSGCGNRPKQAQRDAENYLSREIVRLAMERDNREQP